MKKLPTRKSFLNEAPVELAPNFPILSPGTKDFGGIVQLVERLVRNDKRLIILTLSDLL